MADRLVHQDVQGQAQVEGGCDRGIDIPQRGEAPDLHLALFIELDTVNGIARDFSQDRKEIELFQELPAMVVGDDQYTHRSRGGLDGDKDTRQPGRHAHSIWIEQQRVVFEIS